jgi:hypothetical protein
MSKVYIANKLKKRNSLRDSSVNAKNRRCMLNLGEIRM